MSTPHIPLSSGGTPLFPPASRLSALVFGVLLTLAVGFPALAQEADLDEEDDYLEAIAPVTADPLEWWNRAMFTFNDWTMDYVGRPLYKGYSCITPEFFRRGLKNIFYNLLFPVRFTNNLLQGKGMAAGVEMSRFVLNTTAGLGGLFDVAESHKSVVPVDREDMGQTFGVWGIGEGFYIVWPFLGPSTLRDSVGLVGDYFLDPLTYVPHWQISWGLKTGRVFNELDDILNVYDELRRAAIEPYTAVREGYVQFRRAKISK